MPQKPLTKEEARDHLMTLKQDAINRATNGEVLVGLSTFLTIIGAAQTANDFGLAQFTLIDNN